MRQYQRDTEVNLLGRILAFMVLLPIFLTASFAYQAGNNFELTAGGGSSRAVPSSQTIHVSKDKHPAGTRALPPHSPNVDTAAMSLLIIYVLRILIALFRSPHPLLLKRLLLRPIKVTGSYVE
jgi:hypothetical protein